MNEKFGKTNKAFAYLFLLLIVLMLAHGVKFRTKTISMLYVTISGKLRLKSKPTKKHPEGCF